MAFTKIAAAGIGSTETVTLDGLSVINNGSFGGNLTVGGVLTYEDVTNVDSVGLITARNGIVVGSGITLSKDGDGFFTGVVTATTFSGAFSGDGSALTGIAVGIATTVATGITGITTVLDLSNNDHKITVSGITTVDVRGGTEGESHSLRIINSGITTVGFSTYFLFPSGSSPIIPTTDGTLSMISFTVHRQGAVGLATQLFAGASVNFS